MLLFPMPVSTLSQQAALATGSSVALATSFSQLYRNYGITPTVQEVNLTSIISVWKGLGLSLLMAFIFYLYFPETLAPEICL